MGSNPIFRKLAHLWIGVLLGSILSLSAFAQGSVVADCVVRKFAFFASSPGVPKDYAQLKAQIENLGPEIIALYRQMDPTGEFDLGGSSCDGACTMLVHIFNHSDIDFKISRRVTRKSVGSSGLLHFYLRIEDYFGTGQHLFIDPTIRQFFKFANLSKDEMDQVPLIFVGSEKELVGLFERWFSTEELERNHWVETYFDTIDSRTEKHPKYGTDFQKRDEEYNNYMQWLSRHGGAKQTTPSDVH